ncbi:potassium-transporting ATPase subunit KdpC [Thalassospira marina]|uniref:Potassium-transporting ATPase KdpC subunit n=1 Tax=Thalassospira marina TaxID=2048283 RepID=A0ABM6QFD9_9PROT|nr:potassium-transporting ATPase subunit KdpC [Thalassospira marina]AUG55289.1 potassium-transporting ATPase subunit C [Thalassospira marina]
MLNLLRPAIGMAAVMTVITGVAYPLAMTGIGQGLFAEEANGSLIKKDGVVVGSRLIGQKFESDRYFHPRPSYAGDGYEGDNSGGSNLGATSKELVSGIKARSLDLSAKNGNRPVPIDLLTASGSGLDPDISPESARFQMERVAKARNMPLNDLEELVAAHIEERTFGLIGEPRVNVLMLNLALDEISS